MFDYKNFDELKKYKENYYNNYEVSKKVEQLINIFLKIIDDIEFIEEKEMNKMQQNIYNLTVDSFFIIKEIIDNLMLKNVYSIYFGMRNLIERIITIKFLTSKDDYTNEVFYDYARLKLINIKIDDNIKKFENKYKIKINLSTDNQWINIVNKYNGWKYNSGFASIKQQTIETKKETNNINRLYRFYCNFCHISYGATILNLSVFLEDEEKIVKKMENNVSRHLSIILKEMILENYNIKVLESQVECLKVLYEQIKELEKI